MQRPRYPYDYARMGITAMFDFTSPLTGVRHGAWDIVPFYKRFDGKPADVYPVFSGQTMSVQDTSNKLGRGIKVRTNLWPDLKAHLKKFGITGTFIDILYWHLLDVTDEDGWVDQNTPVGITGNTGAVYSGSYRTASNPAGRVPDSMKGVPPYPGLHLHLEMVVGGKKIDPDIIFKYKPQMSQIKSQAKGAEKRLVLSASSWEEWLALCKVYGVDPNSADEKVRDA